MEKYCDKNIAISVSSTLVVTHIKPQDWLTLSLDVLCAPDRCAACFLLMCFASLRLCCFCFVFSMK